MSGIDIDKLLEDVRQSGAGGHRALGRLIRLIDDNDPSAEAIDKAVGSTAFRAARIGLTGPPGSGKSSLIASALDLIAEGGKKVGVLAVDPTSPFTGGALLGDRVRLKGPVGGNVFFRSLASRGAMGGVSRAIWPASRILDWWGADIILIETVGSGQLGTGVGDVADIVVAVLTPEAGDGVQSMKAGVMELADCFVVNKSDRPGAELVLKELKLMREEARMVGRSIEVHHTSAVNDEGIQEVVDSIRSLWKGFEESGETDRRRLEQVRREVEFRLRDYLYKRIENRMGGSEAWDDALSGWAERIIAGDATPGEAAGSLWGE